MRQRTITGITSNLVLLLFLGLTMVHQIPVYSQALDQDFKYPQPKVISFNPDSDQYQELFDAEKDTVIFYSGVVTVKPNESGELHSTKTYEEMIIPLEGEGQLKITNHKVLSLKYGSVAFVPPNTEHQMFNNGTKNFKYIYIATKLK